MSSINNNMDWNSNRVSFDPKIFTYTYYIDDNINNQIAKSNSKTISTTNTSTVNYCDYKKWKLPTSTNFYDTYDTYSGYCTTHISSQPKEYVKISYEDQYVEIPYEDQYVEIPLEL